MMAGEFGNEQKLDGESKGEQKEPVKVDEVKPDEKDNKQGEIQSTDAGEEIPAWAEMLTKAMDKINDGLEKT